MNTVSQLSKKESVLSVVNLVFEMNGSTAVAAFSPEVAAEYKGTIDLKFWESDLVGTARGAASAIMHVIDGKESIGFGFLLKDKPMLMGVPMKGNFGYVIGQRLKELYPSSQVRGGELEAGGVYRLTWDGFTVVAREVVYAKYVVGEGEEQKHDRSALRLFRGTQVLYASQAYEIRVHFAWASQVREGQQDYSKLMTYVEKLYGLRDDRDALDELRATGMAKAQLWSKTGAAFRKMARGQEPGATEMRVYTRVAGDKPETIEITDAIIGTQVQVFRGALPLRTVTFSEDSWKQQANGIATGGFTVQVVTD